MAKDCPNCRLTNPESAKRCDCGYDFESRGVKQPYFQATLLQEGSGSRFGGRIDIVRILLIGVGIASGSLTLFLLFVALVAVVALCSREVQTPPIGAPLIEKTEIWATLSFT